MTLSAGHSADKTVDVRRKSAGTSTGKREDVRTLKEVTVVKEVTSTHSHTTSTEDGWVSQ